MIDPKNLHAEDILNHDGAELRVMCNDTVNGWVYVLIPSRTITDDGAGPYQVPYWSDIWKQPFLTYSSPRIDS